ncbi:MAG: hypothetical protein AAGA58_05625 [Verrucomicrobiota bacterium]
MKAWGTFLLLWGATMTVDAQELRTWTSTKGTTLEAKLKNYSSFDITLTTPAGADKTVERKFFVEADIEYLDDYPDLKIRKKPKKLPWVSVEAVVSSRSKDTYYSIYGTRYDRRSIRMSVEVANRSKETLEVEVIWGFFAESAGSGRVVKGLDDLYPFDTEMTTMKLAPGQSTKFFTDEATQTQVGYNQSYKGGSKVKGFFAQVYYDGWLIDGFSSHHTVDDASENENLLELVKKGGMR